MRLPQLPDVELGPVAGPRLPLARAQARDGDRVLAAAGLHQLVVVEPADQEVVGEEADTTHQPETVPAEHDLRLAGGDPQVQDAVARGVGRAGHHRHVAGQLGARQLPQQHGAQGGGRRAPGPGPGDLQPGAQQPGEVAVAQQRVVCQVDLLDVGQVAEGAELYGLYFVVVQLEPLQLGEAVEAVRGEHRQLVAGQVQGLEMTEAAESLLIQILDLVAAQIDLLQVLHVGEKVGTDSPEPIPTEAELQGVVGEAAGVEVAVLQLDAVDPHTLAMLRLLCVAEAAGRAVHRANIGLGLRGAEEEGDNKNPHGRGRKEILCTYFV